MKTAIGETYVLPWWFHGDPVWVLVCYHGSYDSYGNYGREVMSRVVIGERLEKE
jgi:hypothetical protein